MNKAEFLLCLRKQLAGLSDEDAAKAVEYYSEMIDDRIEGGMTEEEAVADVGTPENAAKEILMDMPLSKVVKAKIRKERSIRWWEVMLIILGAPLWIPIVTVLLAVVFTVIVSLVSVIIAFVGCVIGLIFGGLAFVVVGIWAMFRAMFASGLFGIGIGLGAIGCGILAVILVILSVKFTVWLMKCIGRLIKSAFVGKEKTA